jgi:hypothetical protein
MTKMDKEEIREIARTVIREVVGDDGILPQCKVEQEKIEGMRKALESAVTILTGGDHPEDGLVAKSIRMDGALAKNREDIATVQKALDKRGNREWSVWLALILMAATTVWNVVFGR